MLSFIHNATKTNQSLYKHTFEKGIILKDSFLIHEEFLSLGMHLQLRNAIAAFCGDGVCTGTQ